MRTRWLSCLPVSGGSGNDEKLKPGQLRVKLKLVRKDGSWKVAENTRIA